MSIIIFLIILALLVLVHEFGHFITAKFSGIRVDEFGIGFPPKIKKLFRWKGTDFTLNTIPFGGFVKIFGENPDAESISGPDIARSFVHKPRYIQALVLSAGVLCNIIFAWLLISFGFVYGLPTPVSSTIGQVKDARLIITSVAPHSPAETAHIKAGDAITSISYNKEKPKDLSPQAVSDFINSHDSKVLAVNYARGDEKLTTTVTPAKGIVVDRSAIGISMDLIGVLKLPIHKALWQGAITTWQLTEATAVGLATFFGQAIVGKSNFSQVTGPVGIVGLVGDVTKLGFIYLLSFTAFISINLAVINLIPFPALDGGRLLFVVIESIKRSRINPKITNTLNAVGFVLLLLLMAVVTLHDIVKLF